MNISKIVSGGQTGVDRGALEAAVNARFPYGGMIPKGRLSEDGTVPAKYESMVESETEDYRFRTRWNAEHSDATLILSFAEELEGGTQRTRQYCMNVRKPFFIDNPSNPKMDGKRIAVFKWLEEVSHKNGEKPLVLNVAGPRESKSPGIAEASEKYVARIIAAQRRVEAERVKLDPLEMFVKFWEPYADQMSEKGVDVLGCVPSWLPKIKGMTVERPTLRELRIHSVPRLLVSEVKQSIKSGVVHELGWTEEPSHVVIIGFIESKLDGYIRSGA